ncbi:MAG: hypothetical protein NT138_00430 [Planctomycetales bacterium]|nr:hypothetical protein [Planctomycetales bacterium]
MIGRLILKFRQKFQHGLRTAWFRDVLRPRILKTDPIEADDRSVCEIHVMTSDSDWLNLIWTLKSFYQGSGRRYALCLHDDGTLSATARETLQSHFPMARIVSRSQADAEVLPTLISFPKCGEFRRSNLLAPKVFDFRHYLKADRMLLLDSDVLFFTEPLELLRRLETPEYRLNCVNGDIKSAYTVTPELARQHCDVRLIERFNSGLGVIHRESLNLDWIEEFLAIPGIIGNFWLIEQTLYALCSSRFGVELLPAEYDVFLKGEADDRPSRHYVGAIRHLMYKEGMRKLVVDMRGW